MNILFTSTAMFDPYKGGIERVTDIIAKELKHRGHNIFYMNTIKDDSRMDYDYPGKVTFIDEYASDHAKRTTEYVNFLKKNEIDIIVNQGGVMKSCNFFCETGDSKAVSVSVVHSDPSLNYKGLLNEILTLRNNSIREKIRRILRLIYYPVKKRKYREYLTSHYSELASKSDHIVLLSDGFKPTLKSFVPDIDESKIFSIGNPSTYEVIRSEVQKEKIVIFVGRMDAAAKNPYALIQIWKRIVKKFPGWQLVMIGGGNALESIKLKAANVANIIFTGYCNPEPYYKKAGILCMTSNYEGWGMVLVEAMAHGVVPMAFSSYASVHELLRDPIQKVTPFSKREYAAKLNKLMSDDSLRADLVEKGYKIVDEYSIEHIVDIWEDYFKKIKK